MQTAALVLGPKIPSAVMPSSICSCFTASPLLPFFASSISRSSSTSSRSISLMDLRISRASSDIFLGNACFFILLLLSRLLQSSKSAVPRIAPKTAPPIPPKNEKQSNILSEIRHLCAIALRLSNPNRMNVTMERKLNKTVITKRILLPE